LTVARASADQRHGLLDQVRCAVVDAAALAAAADAVAAERRSERVGLHNRALGAEERAADAVALAADREQAVRQRQERLRAEARWADHADEEVEAARAAVAAAEAEAEARQAAQRTALAKLDRVLEQRAAASAAMSDAEQQLSDLGVAELDESGLRRELEASGHAVRAAKEAHTEALAVLAARQADLDDVCARHIEASEALAELDASVAVEHAPESVEAVAVALEQWALAAADAGIDDRAVALADAWNDLQADLASVTEASPVPDERTLDAAAARVEEARHHLAVLEAATGSGPLSDAARAEIDAAHEAVLSLEERSGRRLGGGGARRELEQAKAREDELLARHGFASYIDVVLTGGRARHDTPELLAAARAYRNAVSEREALVAATAARPELAYLDGERDRLLRHCVDLLGVDPGDAVVTLLREHPAVPSYVMDGLRSALAAVGVRPVGQSLPDAATTWLGVHRPSPGAGDRSDQDRGRLEADVAALSEARERATSAVAEAEQAVADAEAALQQASRSVSAFESELSMRADEDARRLQRFAAAEQLRNQIEAVATTLAKAEQDTREALESAAAATAVADAALDQATARLADLTRRVRDLLAELPEDRRPEGEPLAVLPELAAALVALADDLDGEAAESSTRREQAEAELERARAEAAEAAAALECPTPADHLEAMHAVLDAEHAVLLLDDPFAAAPLDATEVQAALLSASLSRAVVLLTEDPELLGWAIELPSEVGRVVPIDALNLGAGPADEEAMERAILELSDRGTSEGSDAPTTPASRWAGRR
jgi:hypothetical protein